MYYNTERDALSADKCYVILFGQDLNVMEILFLSKYCTPALNAKGLNSYVENQSTTLKSSKLRSQSVNLHIWYVLEVCKLCQNQR